MNQRGAIYSLQKASLSNWGDSKCVHSNLSFFEKEDEASPLSVKFVLKGTEEYRINGQGFKLHDNQFLVVNNGDDVVTRVKGKQSAQGLCVYPPQGLINEVCTQSNLSLSNKLEQVETSSSNSIRFTSNPIRMDSNANVAFFLSKQAEVLLSGRNLSEEWWESFYMKLADQLVKDQLKLENKLRNLPSAKKHTKEELYRRLSLAKDFIHDHQFETIDIDFLARMSSLSKFHFLRSFKAFYGCSPYQYSLQLKLRQAMTLMQKNYSYKQAADIVGYSDAKNLRKAILRKSSISVH